MGSVVFPEADVKVYLVAQPRCRAMRRQRELAAGGREVDLAVIENEMTRRDTYDSDRRHSPLVVPEGAVTIDTTDLTIDQQVARVVGLAERMKGV
jgi:cytidylate kinase